MTEEGTSWPAARVPMHTTRVGGALEALEGLIPRESGTADDSRLEMVKVEKNTLIWLDTDPQSGKQVICKMYRNRGAISWEREKRFRFRVQREFDSLCHLQAHGVPTTPAVSWSYGTDEEHQRFELLAMECVPGCEPVSELLDPDHAASGTLDLGVMYDTLREMHRAGVFHRRLDSRNILYVEESKEFLIMDTPAAIIFGHDIARSRMAWFDLFQITKPIFVLLGKPRACELLKRYGLSEREVAGVIKDMPDRMISRGTRNRLRFEFGLRANCSRSRA